MPTIPNSLQYTFDFSGGRSNHTMKLQAAEPTALAAIRITTNAAIDNPWGQLGQYWNRVKVTRNGDLYVYELELPQAVNIPQGTFDALTYSVSTALGPITNVAMPPVKFEVKKSGDTQWQAITSTHTNNQNPNPHPNNLLTAYTTNWGEYSYKKSAANLDYDSINDVAYGFIGFDVNGNVKSLDSWGDQLGLPTLAIKKQQYPHSKISIAFGGWTNAGEFMAPVFSTMAANPTARANFVKNAVAAAKQAGADGIDIDWEYPEAKDAANYLALLKELRAELTQQIGPQARLTIAAPAGKDKIDALTPAQWQELANSVDLIKIMSYDYAGAFSAKSDFHAAKKLTPDSSLDPYYCTDKTLEVFAALRIPNNKISVGFPNYARAMIIGQPGNFGGLYQPVLGAPIGEFGQEGGVYSWKAIKNVLDKKPSELDKLGVTQWQYFDSNHPFCKNANMCMLTGQMPDGRWVTLNFIDEKCAAERAQEFKAKGYAGMMLWADYNETDDPANAITKAMSNGLDGKVNQYQMAPTTHEEVETHRQHLKTAFWHQRLATDKHEGLGDIASARTQQQAATQLRKHETNLSKPRYPLGRLLSQIGLSSGKTKSLKLGEKLLAQFEPTQVINVNLEVVDAATPRPKM